MHPRGEESVWTSVRLAGGYYVQIIRPDPSRASQLTELWWANRASLRYFQASRLGHSFTCGVPTMVPTPLVRAER